MKKLLYASFAVILFSCKNEPTPMTEQPKQSKDTVRDLGYNKVFIDNAKVELITLKSEVTNKQALLNSIIGLHSQCRMSISDAKAKYDSVAYEKAIVLVKGKNYSLQRINFITDSLIDNGEREQHFRATDSVLTLLMNEFKSDLN
ncbi:MAG: hypothetical protein ABIP51_09840 [Bacteroidia bacterium]